MAEPAAREPQILLTLERLLCARHGEPFRAQWPKGFPIFTVKAFQVVASKPEIAAAVEGDVRGIERLLDEKPACCRLTSDEMLALYGDAGIGVVATCQNCRRFALGTPYSRSMPGGVEKDDHICFECVLHWMRPLS